MPAGVRQPLLAGVATLAAGIGFASVPLLVPGVALVTVTVAVWFWGRLAGLGARVERTSLPARVVEGAPFEMRVVIRAGFLPLFASLEDPVLARPVRVRSWRPRARIELTLEAAVERRGRHELTRPALRLTDPFGLVRREISGDATATITVLPRIEPIETAGGGNGRGLGARIRGFGDRAGSLGRESPAEPDLEGLRPYRAGTPASRIYWPALARGEELLEIRLTPPGGTGPTVVVDASDPADPEALDRAVRAAASLCVHLAQRGGCDLILPGSRQPLSIGASLESWPDAHLGLALVEAGDALRPGAIPVDAPVFWVTARTPAADLPPGARGYLVSALGGPTGAQAPAFTVAGCVGFPLAFNRRTRPALAVVS